MKIARPKRAVAYITKMSQIPASLPLGLQVPLLAIGLTHAGERRAAAGFRARCSDRPAAPHRPDQAEPGVSQDRRRRVRRQRRAPGGAVYGLTPFTAAARGRRAAAPEGRRRVHRPPLSGNIFYEINYYIMLISFIKRLQIS